MANKGSTDRNRRSARVIFTIPKDLAAELEQYAGAVRDGNKSGFAADAIRWYIDHFRRRRHTALLRQSYAAAAGHGKKIDQEWQPLDDEAWARVDALKKQPRKPR